MDETELLERLKSLHESVALHADTLRFVMAMLEQSLVAQVKQAYILERLLNHSLDGTKLDGDDLRAVMREIRTHFDRQRTLMQEGPSDE